jgi:hypothetical protein
MVMDHNASDMAPIIPQNGTMSSVSEMPVSPTSVASSGHFPFTASEISGMGTDASVLDSAFTSDVVSSVGLQLAPDGGNGISRSLDQIQWNFSLSDLTADLPNLGGNFLSRSSFRYIVKLVRYESVSRESMYFLVESNKFLNSKSAVKRV